MSYRENYLQRLCAGFSVPNFVETFSVKLKKKTYCPTIRLVVQYHEYVGSNFVRILITTGGRAVLVESAVKCKLNHPSHNNNDNNTWKCAAHYDCNYYYPLRLGQFSWFAKKQHFCRECQFQNFLDNTQRRRRRRGSKRDKLLYNLLSVVRFWWACEVFGWAAIRRAGAHSASARELYYSQQIAVASI